MSNSPDQIQQEIDRSRQDAAQKIDQIGSQVQDVAAQAQDTVKQDVPEMVKEGLDVAKSELKEDMVHVGAGSAGLAGAALLGGVAGLYFLHAVMELLAERLPRWQAATIVALGLSGAAAALGLTGKEQLRPEQLKPKRTMSVLQQTTSWAKSQMAALTSRSSQDSSAGSGTQM